MNPIKNVSMALAVLALGALAPGCAPHPDETLGSLCAASENGEPHCVRSNQGPAAAWSQAAPHGELPVQMWAKRPDAVALEDLVGSPTLLKAWFADTDKVHTYVRDTKKNAESYLASMGGHGGRLLDEAINRQQQLLSRSPVDAIGDFKAALNDKASAEKSPVVAALATDKQSMTAVQTVFEKARTDIASLESAYAGLAAQFTTYRATEAAETQTYKALAQQASQATLATLPDVEQAILTAGLTASATPNDLALNAMKLSAQLQSFELSSQAALTPHTDFLATHGAALPDMSSGALRSLNAMLGYIQQRITRSDATATSLLNGIVMRRQALVVLNAGQPMGSMIAQAKLLKARTSFDATANARIAVLLAAPTGSKALKLPYLARRYDQLTAFLQLQPLCDPSSSSWREAGCVSLRNNFSAAETYLKITLPLLITTGLATLGAHGVDVAQLAAVQAKLTTGDVKGAAVLYDAAVRGTEGT
jgi:hypothetical protein